MTKNDIGWFFPPTHGGQETYFHDAGIETFGTRPLNSLAREVIQNSLDARKDEAKPVHVAFEICTVNEHESFGATQLTEHLKECFSECQSSSEGNQRREIQFFENAKNVMTEKVSFLRIYDENTTGLREKEWKALVKQTGKSMKSKAGAGGSFGIGKYAPFAVSLLRTVFYWTCYKHAGKRIEQFQGKSILISHHHEYYGTSNMSQGIGFFGDTNECTPLIGKSIPNSFRVLKKGGETILGTALWIAGFRNETGWQLDIAQNVIENFFYAILNNKLEITLEFDSDLGIDENLGTIDSVNLQEWLLLMKTKFENSDERTDDLKRVRKTISFLKLFEDGTAYTTEIDELGKCDLRILVEDHLPSEVALIRGTGMLITCQQEGLQRFPKTKDFISACVLNSDEANVLLREMENPEHNHFDVSRLLPDDREKGRKALDHLKNWIREKVNECAGEIIVRSNTNVDELASYLPDIDSPGSLNRNVADEVKHAEKAFGVPGQIRLVPPSYKPTPIVDLEPLPPPNPTPEPNPDPDPNPKPDPAPNPVPPEPNPRPRKAKIELVELRVIPFNDDPSSVKVVFVVDYTGVVKLEVRQATDDQPAIRDDIDLIFSGSNSAVSCRVNRMYPCEFRIHSNRKINDVAWTLQVYKTN